MALPSLTFFNEQDEGELASTFLPEVLDALRALGASVAMGMRDLSSTRADVIRRLNAAGVPVTAWVLLPREHGYFATHHNVDHVAAACEQVLEWAKREALSIGRLGLDFEPDIRELDTLMARPLTTFVRRAFTSRATGLVESRARYQALISDLRRGGVEVETYQFPVVVDDRTARSQFWQRTLGALTLEADREVVMLYTSLMGPFGHALLHGYAPRCQAIAVGSTGGGIDPFPKLSVDALVRDLVVAARFSPHLYVFSLEGCVSRALLERLRLIDWSAPISAPSRTHRALARATTTLTTALARWSD